MLLEYQLDWIKIVDFLLMAKFWASLLFFDSPSSHEGVMKESGVRKESRRSQEGVRKESGRSHEGVMKESRRSHEGVTKES